MMNDITNTVLLEHMQAMKNDLSAKIDGLSTRVGHLETKTGNVEVIIESLETKMDRGFEQARLHREALQEDLDASIRMLAKHDRKLARL